MTIQDTIESLEAERTALHARMKSTIFPCPSCGKDVRGMKWDFDKGGECVHCLGWIEAAEMVAHVEASTQRWYTLCALVDRINEARRKRHLAHLSKGLDPWDRFLSNGLREEDFTVSLYLLLSNTFNHIAHFDRVSFYRVMFGTLESQIQTLETIMTFNLDPHVTENGSFPRYSEALERKIRNSIEVTDILTTLKTRHARETEAQERALLLQLLSKYGPLGV